MLEDIDNLKAAQDALDQRANALLDKFIPFRDQFIEHLRQFTAAAVEKGLRGVNKLKIKKGTPELLEATLTLHEFNLVIIASDTVYPMDWEDRKLGSKILIYRDGNEPNTPFMEVVFREADDANYLFWVEWFAQSEKRHLAGGHPKFDPSGQEAAEAVMHHLYGFEYSWNEKPTLEEMRSADTKKPLLGFVQEP